MVTTPVIVTNTQQYQSVDMAADNIVKELETLIAVKSNS